MASRAPLSAIQNDPRAVEWIRRARGAAAGGLVGDVLGAAFEGMDPATIAKEQPGGCRQHVAAPAMGVEFLGPRVGRYTDDTNSAAALLASLSFDNGKLIASHVAYRHARFWRDGVACAPLRGYPGSAQQMMLATLAGRPARECATLAFPDGSFANGAAMKIYPIAVAFGYGFNGEDASNVARFRRAVEVACAYSHVNPLGVDAAVIQAHAVRMAMAAESAAAADPAAFIAELSRYAATDRMRDVLSTLGKRLADEPTRRAVCGVDFDQAIPALLDVQRAVCGSHARFQIEGPGAVGASLAAFFSAPRDPHAVVARAIAMGGDTDTIATMAAAVSGALVGGSEWCDAPVWAGIENGERGRDWIMQQAEAVATTAVSSPTAFEIDDTTPMPTTALDHAWAVAADFFADAPKNLGVPLSRLYEPATRARLPEVAHCAARSFHALSAGSSDGSATAPLDQVHGLAPALLGDTALLAKFQQQLGDAATVTKEAFVAALQRTWQL